MKPIKFNQANVTYAEDQPQYLPLPACKVGNREGEVITCWQLSFLERVSILLFGKVWFRQLTFYNPLQPVNMSVTSPFEDEKPKRTPDYILPLNLIVLRTKKAIAFWIWRNLSGGATPFYVSPKLDKFKAPTPPEADAWRGWKLKLWNKATDYLVGIGELTHTPTLREKF